MGKIDSLRLAETHPHGEELQLPIMSGSSQNVDFVLGDDLTV